MTQSKCIGSFLCSIFDFLVYFPILLNNSYKIFIARPCFPLYVIVNDFSFLLFSSLALAFFLFFTFIIIHLLFSISSYSVTASCNLFFESAIRRMSSANTDSLLGNTLISLLSVPLCIGCQIKFYSKTYFFSVLRSFNKPENL